MKKKITTTTTTTVVETIETNSKPTHIKVVLDRSGSMASISQATVDGLNSLIREQKAEQGSIFMSLVQFDSEYQVDYKRKSISDVEYLINGVTFVPRASTALFDAIGRTINETELGDDILFIIITDGQNNVIQEFNKETVFQMIENKKKEGWKFLFLGANQDAIKAGGSLGVSLTNSVTFNSNNSSVQAAYSTLSNKLSSYRSFKSIDASADALASLDFSDQDRSFIDK